MNCFRNCIYNTIYQQSLKIHKFKTNTFCVLFYITTVVGSIKIPQNLSEEFWNDELISVLKKEYESRINADLGIVIMIIDDTVKSTATTISDNGELFQTVQFDALTFYPKLLEIVRGEIVEITDFGAFVRIGPIDALLHLSQILDDYLKTDVREGIIYATQTGKSLKLGARIRSRITTISSLDSNGSIANKIGLTCRQPFLGADEWFAK